jgi:hypothetical protein
MLLLDGDQKNASSGPLSGVVNMGSAARPKPFKNGRSDRWRQLVMGFHQVGGCLLGFACNLHRNVDKCSDYCPEPLFLS